MKNTVLVLGRNQEKYRTILSEMRLPDLEIFTPDTEEQILEILPKANILLANPPIACRYINNASNLTWMQSTFTGVDLMISDKLRSDYLLTNVKDAYGDAMAEYIFAYILMFEKEVLENIEAQDKKYWAQKPFFSLKGKVLGIMGTGSIGTHIAMVGKAFQMTVLGFNTSGKAGANFDITYSAANKTEFFNQCDFLVSVLPSTSATKQIISKTAFEQMKQSCVFINVGRGDVLNEADLILALKNNQIKAAVLDVFEKEPLPPEHSFWHTPNLYLTPHVSGYVVSEQIFEIFKQNYYRFISGQQLLFQVDFQKGY